MEEQGLSGMSFPFRFNTRGGVAMSTVNHDEATHINESIEQILLTRKGERAMESFGSECHHSLFEISDNEAVKAILKLQTIEALEEYEKRIIIDEVSVEYKYEQGKSFYLVTIYYTIKKFGTTGNTTVKIGDE